TDSGIGDRRTVIAVTMPSVPSLPTTAPTQSKPGANPVALPSSKQLPSGSTSSSASTWWVVVPYLSVCGPPAFSATLPPSVHASLHLVARFGKHHGARVGGVQREPVALVDQELLAAVQAAVGADDRLEGFDQARVLG